jgi:hypothetical protein
MSTSNLQDQSIQINYKLNHLYTIAIMQFKPHYPLSLSKNASGSARRKQMHPDIKQQGGG